MKEKLIAYFRQEKEYKSCYYSYLNAIEFSEEGKVDFPLLFENNLEVWKEHFLVGKSKGDEYSVCFSLRDSSGKIDSYWKIPGWYSSGYGAELYLHGICQVRPIEKRTIEWETLND